MHEAEVQNVCCIKAQTVDIEFLHPEPDCLLVILFHLRVVQVELWQQVVASPVRVRKAVVVAVVAPEVHIQIPVSVAAVLTVLLKIAEGEKVPPCMV